MSQLAIYSWTNANPAVSRNLNCGFTVTRVTTYDITSNDQWVWTRGFADNSSMDVTTGIYVIGNGVTPLSQNSTYGATISGFTNANPGVITVDDTETFGFAAGDTVKVAGLADDGTGDASLNNTFTVASVTATTITLVEDTSVTGYSVYVSGGIVTRVSDTNGVAIPTENFAIQGVTIGTTPVGANGSEMVAVVEGENSVT